MILIFSIISLTNCDHILKEHDVLTMLKSFGVLRRGLFER